MNERIKQLAEQATIRGEEYLPGDNGHPTATEYFDKEKFAELIVQECADLYKNEDGRPWFDKFQYKEVLKIYSKQIKEHFGVEE